MKKIFLMAAVAVAAMFTSCSKESGIDTAPAGSEAKLTLSIKGSATKATGDFDPDNADNLLNDLTIFFFRNDGTFDRTPIKLSTPANFAAEMTDISVTTALKDVYVIANIGSLSTASIVNLDLLKAFDADMANGVNSVQTFPTAADGTGANVYQCGKATVSAFSDSPKKATGSVVLGFVPARIKVAINYGATWTTNNSGNANTSAPSGKYVEITDIVVLNAKAKTLFFPVSGTSLYSSTVSYYAGIDPTSFAEEGAPTSVKPFYTESVPAAGHNAFFYVYANDPSVPFAVPAIVPTIVTLMGKKYAHGGSSIGEDIYYSAVFNGVDVAEKIENGKAYTLTFNLNGNPKSGGGGTTDPTTPPVSAEVTLTVTPATWATAGVSKDFN